MTQALIQSFPDVSPKPRILIVDDDDLVRTTLAHLLESDGFEVVEAADVRNAIKLIAEQHFDALLSDLHMPAQGDGLTVVSAMRHVQPKAVTVILSAYPEMKEAAAAIARQADEILLKPIVADELVNTIGNRLRLGTARPRIVETVASILERETQSTIQEWLDCMDIDPLVDILPLSDDMRCAHLPELFRDLIHRLRHPLPLGRRALTSPAAAAYGLVRRRQGYTAAMLVEESRMLQVSIFQTLQDNLHRVDFSVLLTSVMAIADEVDSQLAQAMVSYVSEEPVGDLVGTA